MRRWTVMLAVLAILVGVSTPAGAQDIAAMSFEQLTVANASKTFTATTIQVGNKAAARCVGVLETAEIRIRVDGTVASATVGQVVPVGATVDIRGIDNIRRFSAFRTGGTSGVLPMTCYPSPAENALDSGIRVSPTPAVTAAQLHPDGTVALPAISFVSDPDTGLYRIGANNIGFATNGTIAWDWSAARNASALPVFLPSGSAAAPGLAFTSDAGNDSGLYYIGADNLGVALGGAIEWNLTATAFSPGASNGSALGTTALMWADLFLADGGVINFNNGNATLTHAAGKLTASVPIWNGTGGATTAGSIYFAEGTDNGTNTVQLIGPASTADVVVTLPAATGTVALVDSPIFTTNGTFGAIATQDVIKVLPVTDNDRFTATVTVADLSADRTLTLPNLGGTVALAGGVQNGSTFDATGFLVAGVAGIDKTCGGPVVSATFVKGIMTAMTCTSEPGPNAPPTLADLTARIQNLETILAQMIAERERR